MEHAKWCHTAILLCIAVLALSAVHPSGNKCPRIAILSNTLYSENHSVDGQLGSLAASLRAEGYDVANCWLDSFNDRALEGIDVFVIALPAFPLDQDDREALGRYLEAGGGLLIVVYPNEIYLDPIEVFLKTYGISYAEHARDGLDAKVNQKSVLASPRECELIGGSEGRVYFSLEPDISAAVASSAAGAISAIATGENIGDGRMVTLGSDLLLIDSNIAKLDNLPFILNAVDYLCGAGACDLAVLNVAFRGKSAAPGDELKVVARLKNLGPVASAETKIRFMLCEEMPEGSPPKAVKKYKPTALERIEPGKKWKVKAELTIPASIEPGEYYIVAVADPKAKSDDPFRSNNTGASKKKLVIE